MTKTTRIPGWVQQAAWWLDKKNINKASMCLIDAMVFGKTQKDEVLGFILEAHKVGSVGLMVVDELVRLSAPNATWISETFNKAIIKARLEGEI